MSTVDTDEIPTVTKQEKLHALVMAVLALMAISSMLAIAGVGYLALQAKEESEHNGQLIEEIHTVNERILDCTEASGACYRQGQERTGEAVAGINEATMKIIVAALSCQEDGIVDQKTLARCTVKRAFNEEGQNE